MNTIETKKSNTLDRVGAGAILILCLAFSGLAVASAQNDMSDKNPVPQEITQESASSDYPVEWYSSHNSVKSVGNTVKVGSVPTK